MKQNKIFGSGLSHNKKERIHGEVHTECVLNPFSGQRELWYFIDGVHIDSETLIIEKNKRVMETRYICQLLRISSFDHYGNAVFGTNVPINAYLFDKLDDACEFGDKRICKADVRRGYWGKEYNYEDDVQIICGYIIYETNNQNYCTYNDLPSDRKICREKFCNATFLAGLQSAYEDGGQVAMYKYAKQKYGCYR